MLTKEFGEVEIVQEGYPVGLVIRQNEANDVVLEENFDTTGENVDVVHVFNDEEMNVDLSVKTDFYFCLALAREYEPDLSCPIYIKTSSSQSKEESDAEKKARFMRCAEWSGRHPWDKNHCSG